MSNGYIDSKYLYTGGFSAFSFYLKHITTFQPPVQPVSNFHTLRRFDNNTYTKKNVPAKSNILTPSSPKSHRLHILHHQLRFPPSCTHPFIHEPAGRRELRRKSSLTLSEKKSEMNQRMRDQTGECKNTSGCVQRGDFQE